MERTDRDVTAFLHEEAPGLAALDEVIASAMPGRSRVLWEGVFWGGTQQSIIGYGDLVQARPRGPEVQWFVLGLAQQSAHISLYVNAVAEGEYLSRRYGPRLGKVKVGAAAVTFPSADAIDHDVLAELAAEANALCPPNPA